MTQPIDNTIHDGIGNQRSRRDIRIAYEKCAQRGTVSRRNGSIEEHI